MRVSIKNLVITVFHIRKCVSHPDESAWAVGQFITKEASVFLVANHNLRGETRKTCFKQNTSMDQIHQWIRHALRNFERTEGTHVVVQHFDSPIGHTVRWSRGGIKFTYHCKLRVVYKTRPNHPFHLLKVTSAYPVPWPLHSENLPG